MKTEILWQDWNTLRLDTSGTPSLDSLIQPAAGWLDIGNLRTITIRRQVLAASNAELWLHTAPALNGPWTRIGTLVNSAGITIDTFNSEGGNEGVNNQIQRFLRWVVLPAGGDPDIAFKIGVVPPAGCDCSNGKGIRTVGRVGEGWATVAAVVTASPPASSDVTEVVQSSGHWIDTRGMANMLLEMQIASIENCDVIVEGAVSADGPWIEVLSSASPSTDREYKVLSLDFGANSTNAIYRYYRWRAEYVEPGSPPPPDVEWGATFQVRATPRR